jgi:hypothetical protein
VCTCTCAWSWLCAFVAGSGNGEKWAASSWHKESCQLQRRAWSLPLSWRFSFCTLANFHVHFCVSDRVVCQIVYPANVPLRTCVIVLSLDGFACTDYARPHIETVPRLYLNANNAARFCPANYSSADIPGASTATGTSNANSSASSNQPSPGGEVWEPLAQSEESSIGTVRAMAVCTS